MTKLRHSWLREVFKVRQSQALNPASPALDPVPLTLPSSPLTLVRKCVLVLQRRNLRCYGLGLLYARRPHLFPDPPLLCALVDPASSKLSSLRAAQSQVAPFSTPLVWAAPPVSSSPRHGRLPDGTVLRPSTHFSVALVRDVSPSTLFTLTDLFFFMLCFRVISISC